MRVKLKNTQLNKLKSTAKNKTGTILRLSVGEWIYTLRLLEYQETPCPKQAGYLKIKWQQRDLNPQPLSS